MGGREERERERATYGIRDDTKHCSRLYYSNWDLPTREILSV